MSTEDTRTMIPDPLRHGRSQRGDHDELDSFVRGQGRYTSDIALTGQCFAAFVRSPMAHARVLRIDTSIALAQPGVQTVITGSELVQAGLGTIRPMAIFNGRDGQPMKQAGIPVLASDVVRHVGEAVAMVVADTETLALNAAEQVLIEWESLPVVVEPHAALAAHAVQVHADAPGNVALDWADGDAAALDAAFLPAAHIETVELDDPPMTACAMEPKAAIAQWDAQNQRFTLVASTQGVMLVRKLLAEHVFNMPLESIRVITPHVGGGFGAKVQTYPEYAALLYASRILNRPVRWTASRLECFLGDTQARNTRLKARMAFDREGRILGLHAELVVGIGAYTSTYIAIVGTNNTKNCLSSVYRIPVIRTESRLVFTHTMPHGPYRGAGRPEAIYMIERLLDKAAPSLGLDRVELRRRNLVPASAMPYHAANAMVYDSGDFESLLNQALELSRWSSFEERRQQSTSQGRLRGIGLCCFLEVAGGILEEPADLRFNANGTVSLHMGAQAMGQGHQSTYPQLIAQRLGIDISQVQLIAGDSDQTPGIVATVASRSTMMVGSASAMACDEAVRRGHVMAAHVLEASTEDIRFEAGRFHVVGTDHSVHLLDLTARFATLGNLPEGIPTTLSNVAKFVSPGMTFPNGCHVCEVEIDPQTGEIEVVDYTAVDDVGVMLNPAVIEGQIMGGVAQGLGQVLGERLHYDSQGQLLNASLMDYPVPRADTVPHMTIAHHSVPCTTNPLGVKGAGESGVAGSLPSAVNAILHALSQAGVTTLDMPFTSQRVWSALHQAHRSR